MGGKGSGGARPNSGPRRLTAAEIALRGGRLRGSRRLEALKMRPPGSVPAPPVVVTKPKGLPTAQSAVWNLLAPLAWEQRTLTPATAFAFQQGCKVIVLEQKMADEIEAKGLTSVAVDTNIAADGGGSQLLTVKANPLLTRHTALLVRVEAFLTRFRLAPMGKELAPAEDAPVANPLDRFIHRKRA